MSKKNYTVHPAPFPFDVAGFHHFSFYLLLSTVLAVPLVPMSLLATPYWSYPLWLALSILPTYISFMVADSYFKSFMRPKGKLPNLPLTEYFKFKDLSLYNYYASNPNAKIPMETFYELYFDDKLELQDGYDILDLLEMRHDWASFQFTWGHVRFMFQNFVKEVSVHSRAQDEEQVRDHYDRGNDFYEAFLGPIMIYTSGIIGDASRRETLEEMQTNKLDLVCNKIQLKSDEKLLDIGCGWGTLIAHAAKNYGAKATGVTLAREQTEFGLNRAKEYGVEDKVNILCKDYRDIPKPSAPNGQLYDKITCLEMAEHVGVFKFNNFLLQVSELLKDDGLFYLQIAGLRRPWQYEDLQWGLFMNKYVFPGADASCPLAWVIGQLEYAGFEVQSVDTIGVHYSATLERWYQNWLKPENKQLMQERYGKRLWKVWEFFLAWSVVASRQGSATCYQIVCHKNSNTFDRVSFLEGYGQRRLKVQQ